MKKFLVSLALASLTIITVSSDVQAHKFSRKRDCVCRGYSDKSKCDLILEGGNHGERIGCELCGWTYINTGEFSLYSNYCKRIPPSN